MGTGNTRKLTKRIVDAVKPGEIIWDSEVKGFGVRCQRRDKVFILKAKARGRWRWMSIGPHGSPWTSETARTEAKRILGEIADKKDPAAIRDAEKTNPTVSQMGEMFLRDHVKVKRKPRTLVTYRDQLERLANPVIGKTRVVDITRSDIAKLHHSLRGTPYQANRTMALLSKMFNWAEQIGYRQDGSNPCRHIEKYPEKKRERFLSDVEQARLGDVLSEAGGRESPYVLAAIRLLMFTGARLSEILTLKWEHVDIENGVLRLPDSKTGQKVVFLNAPALEVLYGIPRIEGNSYVICGEKDGAHLVNLQKPWGRIRKNAGLEDVRLHDLRHSFASVAASGGLSLPMIGKLLGHTQAETTQRYAHLAADPLRAANEAIGQRIAAVMRGDKGHAKIIPMQKRGS